MATKKDEMTDGTEWVMYDKFEGYASNADPQKISDGQSPSGYNTSVNDGDRISLRNKGYEKLGDMSALGTTDPITSMHTFRRRDGKNVMMAAFGTKMAYYNSYSASWELLKSGYTSGQRFGFADYTLHTDTTSQCYFGNGVEYFSRWNGLHTALNGAVSIGAATITVDDLNGWPTSGSIIFGTNEYSYEMKGAITGVTVTTPGTGYNVNDVLTVVYSGASAGTLTVTSINGSGGVTGVTITTGGTNYIATTGLATTVAPAGGTGCVVSVTGINSAGVLNLLGGTALENVADGRGVAYAVTTYSGATYPKGNIYLMANNRLFVSGVSTAPQAVFFSKYGDPVDFSSSSLVTGSTATASGTFNLAEGGGAVTGTVFDEGSIYAFKRTMVYKITLTDTLYVLQQIKPFDGKSQTIGGIAPKCIFTGSNYVFFLTPDKQIMSLERVEGIDYPQNVPISSKVASEVASGDFSDASGITFEDRAYFAFRSSTSATTNDKVFVWNINKNWWDMPITGWNVGDFVVYDNGITEDLYFGSSNSTNVYKVNSTNVDDVFDVTGLYKSKQYTFGAPQTQKIMTDLFIEGYLTESTNLNITLYLDDDGFTRSFATTLAGTETDYLFGNNQYNSFGVNPFGVEVLGGNDDLTGLKKFRIYLNKNFRIEPFYNCQISFGSEGQNQNWEIIDYGFKVGAHTNQNDRKLFKNFS